MRKSIFYILVISGLVQAAMLPAQSLKFKGIFIDSVSKEFMTRYLDGKVFSFSRRPACIDDSIARISYSDKLPDYISTDIPLSPCEYNNFIVEAFHLPLHYLFCSTHELITVERGSGKITGQLLRKPAGYDFFYRMRNDTIFTVTGIPADDVAGFSFRPLFIIGKDGTAEALDEDDVMLPKVRGFDLMSIQHRTPFAFFDDFFALADPCFESLYYYGMDGKLIKQVRLDSLLGEEGICGRFAKEVGFLDADFNDIMNRESAGYSVVSMDNCKGRLVLKIADGENNSKLYYADPATLIFKEIKPKAEREFSWEGLPISKWSVISDGHIINKIEGDIGKTDPSQFADYDSFDIFIGSQEGREASYLVRELVFE